MKYLISVITLALFIASCQPPEEYPTDLAGKQTLLKEKQKELRSLNQMIAQLESEIDSLNPASQKEKPRVLVTTSIVDRSNFDRFIELQATVEADDLISASSETGGRILNLAVQEGQFVKKGQLIAKLDMESINKQIAELEKSLELAKDVYERQKRLWDQNIGSEMQFLQAKNNKERLEKSLETIEFQLTKANVYAPISGAVDMVIAKAGEMTAPGTPIVQILNTSQIKIAADVPEKYLRNVQRGEMVTIKVPALDMETKGRVTMLGRTINPGNRTFKVEVSMPNRNGLLKPNLLASMMINDFSEKNVITIPLELVQQEVSGQDYVFVKKEGTDGAMAQKVKVVTGESYDGNIIIREGLNGGEELIVSGARGLANNELIKIQNSKTPTNNG